MGPAWRGERNPGKAGAQRPRAVPKHPRVPRPGAGGAHRRTARKPAEACARAPSLRAPAGGCGRPRGAHLAAVHVEEQLRRAVHGGGCARAPRRGVAGTRGPATLAGRGDRLQQREVQPRRTEQVPPEIQRLGACLPGNSSPRRRAVPAAPARAGPRPPSPAQPAPPPASPGPAGRVRLSRRP